MVIKRDIYRQVPLKMVACFPLYILVFCLCNYQAKTTPIFSVIKRWSLKRGKWGILFQILFAVNGCENHQHVSFRTSNH